MSESPESPTDNGRHPALQFLQDNLALIGIVAVVIIAVAIVLFQQGPSEKKSAPVPSITATAGAATSAPSSSATPTATATASATQGPSGSTSSPSPAATAAPSPSATAAAAASEASRIVGDQPMAPEVQNWRPYAEKFSQAYGNTTGGKEAWLARLRPYVTDKLYEGFKTTDISRVTPGSFQTVNTLTEENAYSTFVARYSDRGPIEVLIQVQNDGSWKVNSTGPYKD